MLDLVIVSMLILKASVLLFFGKSLAYTNQATYKLKLEEVSVTYLDKRYVENTVELNKYNESVNLMTTAIMFKFDVDETVMIDVHCYRLTKATRKFPLIHFTKQFKDLVEMEAFDLNRFYLEYTRPQMVWPPKKNVKYVTRDWAPNLDFYPPNIPGGKCETVIHYMFKNGTKFSTNNYIINVAY